MWTKYPITPNLFTGFSKTALATNFHPPVKTIVKSSNKHNKQSKQKNVQMKHLASCPHVQRNLYMLSDWQEVAPFSPDTHCEVILRHAG